MFLPMALTSGIGNPEISMVSTYTMKSKEKINMIIPFTYKSDKHPISSYIITHETNIEVRRREGMIAN